MGCGLFRVGRGVALFVRGSWVEGRKESMTGVDGSWGRREADGLRIQC